MANNFNLRTFLSENKLTKNSKVLNEEYGYEEFMNTVADFYDEGTAEYEKLADAVADAWEKGDIYSQPHEPSTYKAQVLSVAKEIGLDPEALEEIAPQIKEEEPSLEESKQSARDRRIVEMVEKALGIPAPVAEVEISEDEMVQENPLPKYSSIDELMKDIEHGTNEAAHKYKMDKMKSVYEALEAKVGSLEEGEHAEHIDQKAIKQMRKDIAALRKAEEKLRKEYDKKFAVKEKPAKKEAE